MTKQVYIVKNNKGETIGARQSARPYTHALIINNTHVEAYSASEQGANRAVSKFFQYRNDEFKSQHTTAVVPVECIGMVKPVVLTLEGQAYKIKTFHAYKYAVVNTTNGGLSYHAKQQEALHYTLEQAQTHANTRRKPVCVVKVIDPRTPVST